MTDDPNYLDAKRHVEALKGFYIHGIVFQLVGPVAIAGMGNRHRRSRHPSLCTSSVARPRVGEAQD
jgi:hypothetical protein